MKTATMAALLAVAGMGLSLTSEANAAVLTPAQGAAIGATDSFIVHVRRGGGGGGFSGGGRSFSGGGGRSFGGGNRSFGGGGRSFGGGRSIRSGGPAFRPGSSYRGGTAIRRSGPVRNFRPGHSFRANPSLRRGNIRSNRAFVHRRGYRPAGFKRWHPRHLAYRKWHRRPYYGYIIGGIALGSILAASYYYDYAYEPPAPGLCWFWADPSEQSGYWDYCADPS